MAEWEALKTQIDELNLQLPLGSEMMFVTEFLKAGKSWAPRFCDNWIDQKLASNQPIDFFETARHYRIRVDQTLAEAKSSTRGHAYAATLHGAPQQDDSNTQEPQGQKTGGANQKGKYEGKPCLCKEVHLFKNCPYINKSARAAGWKENKATRDEIRLKILKHMGFFLTIKNVANTNILDGITKEKVSKFKENGGTGTPGEDADGSTFSFANMANMLGEVRSTSPIHRSVIYDSGANDHMTFEKDRFVGEISPSKSEVWIGTPMGDAQVHGYGTMKVKGTLNGKPRSLLFENTAYVPDLGVTMISANKLKSRGFFWNMVDNSLFVQSTGQKICNMEDHYGLTFIEFNAMPQEFHLANAIHPRHPEKATPWVWHLRLGHCRPEVIQHLKKSEDAGIEVLKGDAPKTVNCTSCAVSKMHEIGQRSPTGRAIKPFQVLHFDLTINNMGFDGTRCIAHFTDEFTSFSYVYPLVNHRESTLIPVFKSLINQCDRAGIAIGSVVSTIRTGQETSIGKDLEDWVLGQGIRWDWSAKNTPQQNGTSEKFGHLLTEKARCIRHHSKLPEDLYPDCYLAAVHLLNRTPTKSLNWDSPLVAMQRATNQVIRWEVSHLRVFGCKAYPLLKGKDKPLRSEKMKPRAFVGYLIGYDATNIFRIWNPEKGDVSGYRDVVFNESEYYDTYDQAELLTESEKADFVEFRAMDPHPSFTPITIEDEDWLETPIRRRLPQPPSSGEGVDQVHQVDQVENMGDDIGDEASDMPSSPVQLMTPDETPYMTPEPPTAKYTGDGRKKFTLSRPASAASASTAPPHTLTPTLVSDMDPVISQNVSQRRKARPKKGGEKGADIGLQQLPETSQTPLDITEREINPRRNPLSADLDEANIIEGTRSRRPNPRYANSANAMLTELEESKLPTSHAAYAFHASFILGTLVKQPASNPKAAIHLSQLPDPPSNWRAMLRHPHAEGFTRAAEVEYAALELRKTWEIVDRDDQVTNPVPLKWVFTYKFNENGFLSKYKARIVVRGDLQETSTQDVYAATLAFKVFRSLMALVAAFNLQTHQLDAVNAFLNAKNDEPVYCFLPDGYKQPGKVMKVLRALYGQRKSPLLWLRTLTMKCLELGLYQAPGEPCLFTNQNGIILFFYVDDIVIAFRLDQKKNVESLVKRFQGMFEIRDLGPMKFFLGVRVTKGNGTVSLVQDSYMEKLAKDYEVDVSKRVPATPLPGEIAPYEGEVDLARMHLYRKKVGSICYPAVGTRPDIAKAASTLSEFLTNPGPDHLYAADHCLRYLYGTRHLGIEYSASARNGSENHLTAEATVKSSANQEQVFEAMADASYGNYPDRKSGEGYVFRLFGGLIDWASRKQSTVTTSTTEAELLSLLHASKEMIWWSNFFKKLMFKTGHILTINNDNLQTIRLMNSEIPRLETKLRHVDISQCWLRQEVQRGHINVDFIPTAKMVADGLTKLLPPQKHQTFIKQLGLKDLKEEILKSKGEPN